MATVTLTYRVPFGIQKATFMLALVSSVPLFRGELDLLGMTVTSDSSVIMGSQIKRTVVLATTAMGALNFPTPDALKFATRGLYRETLGLGALALVAADEPVVT